MSSDITSIIPFVVAFLFAYLYATEEKKERMIEKYLWLYICMSLIIFGFINVSNLNNTTTITSNVPLYCVGGSGTLSLTQCGTTITNSTTTFDYIPDMNNNAFGDALGIVYVILTCLFVRRIVMAKWG